MFDYTVCYACFEVDGNTFVMNDRNYIVYGHYNTFEEAQKAVIKIKATIPNYASVWIEEKI